MNNMITPHMSLWLGLPDTKESVLFSMVDGIGQFDVNQQVVKGTIKFAEVFEMPFFCLRADLVGGQHGIISVVITTFRHGEQWLTTMVEGRQPSFLAHKSVEVPLELLKMLIEGAEIPVYLSNGRLSSGLGCN